MPGPFRNAFGRWGVRSAAACGARRLRPSGKGGVLRHPTKCLRFFLASLVAAGWLAVALSLTMSASFAQGAARDLSAESANIYAGGGGSLSAASGAGMAASVANFLATKGHGTAIRWSPGRHRHGARSDRGRASGRDLDRRWQHAVPKAPKEKKANAPDSLTK